MARVRVAAFSISIDGFGAGVRQDLQNPLGVRGLELHKWFFPTAVFKKMQGDGGKSSDAPSGADPGSSRGASSGSPSGASSGSASGTTSGSGPGSSVDASLGTTGIDNDFAAESFENVGAWILGRNMFGPVRGPWVLEPEAASWKGWWGPNPPYHMPVFVLTHHARPPLAMEGGTTFFFVTHGIEAALEKARKAANGKDVRIGGGVSLIRQYLAAGLIDEMHLAISPVLLGEGGNLLAGINLHELGFTPYRAVGGENATHVVVKKG